MMVQRYRRRPDSDIHALEWRGDLMKIPQGWMDRSATDGETWAEVDERGVVVVHTWEGPVRPDIGEFIAQGTKAELYVIRADTMARNYQAVQS